MSYSCRMFLYLIRTVAGATFLLLGANSWAYAVPVTGCEGDCGGNDQVTVDELIKGVSIALGSLPLGACGAFDLNGDGVVSVDELITAVSRSMNGCPPHVEAVECGFTLPAGQDPENVECRTLTVPEDRAEPDGRTVQLAIAVFKSTAAEPAPDAWVSLPGGPGSPLLGAPIPDPIQATRDVVLFDERGVGLSRPSLDCPEYTQAAREGLAVAKTVEEDAADLREAMRACHDRLVGEGVNLSAYNSATSALDVRDAMTALGYRRWNLGGSSYGARLALTIMRDVPDEVRSAFLGSVVSPPTLDWADIPNNMQRSLDTLFANCAADASCNSRYPDLEETFFDLVSRFNQEPVTLQPQDPVTGEPVTLVITGDRLLRGIFQALYSPELIRLLPATITWTAVGNYTLLTLVARSLLIPSPIASINRGVFYTVRCAEQAPFITPEALAAGSEEAREEVKQAMVPYFGQLLFDVCEFWGVEPLSAIEKQPVASSIPTLLFAGEYDPVTPPDYTMLAAETLSQSYFFELRGFSHEVGGSGCRADVIVEFLADPTHAPDGSCIEALPPLGFL
jgi:pimeloyl-ACP methyl ester carboxylesterase